MTSHEAWLSRNYQGDTVECLACSHQCKIANGNRGICQVRKNEGGVLYLEVYGKVIAQHVDPIEKKPVFHFYPGTPIFSIGTIGCNFRCSFCQNWDISQYSKTTEDREDIGFYLPPQAIVEFCLTEQVPSIAYTYNEPAIFFEYAYDTAKIAHEHGLRNVYVSNGFETEEALNNISPYLDAANIDLKSFRDEFYRKVCGGRLEPVKKTIKWLWEHGVWVEVTTLVIPGENDSIQELQSIAEFLSGISPDIPWHLSRYHPEYKMDNPMTPQGTLEKAYAIGKEAGLHYVYVGNILIDGREDTHCPSCGECVIKRSGYTVENMLNNNTCLICNTIIPGRFL